MTQGGNRQTFAVLGGRGMLGSDLAGFLENDYAVTVVDRDNYDVHRGSRFDVFVNANGNSRRFWANEKPLEDFEASVESVYRSLLDFDCETYVYISSSDVYADHDRPERTREDDPTDVKRLSPYGLHKHFSEELVRNRTPRHLILRCSQMLGTRLKKGPFYDMLQGAPLYVTRDSRLQVITTFAVAEALATLLKAGQVNEAWNVGGRGAYSLTGLDKYSAKNVSFAPGAERQAYEMDVWKLNALYPLKTSDEYVEDFFTALREATTG